MSEIKVLKWFTTNKRLKQGGWEWVDNTRTEKHKQISFGWLGVLSGDIYFNTLNTDEYVSYLYIKSLPTL